MSEISIESPHKQIITKPLKFSGETKLDIDIQRSVTYKRTYSSTWTEEYTFPEDVTKVRCAMTWGYGSDERSRIASRSVSIYNISNGGSQLWSVNTNQDDYIKITGGKKYKFQIRVDGYKGRDYGWILYFSTSINNVSTTHVDASNSYVKE